MVEAARDCGSTVPVYAASGLLARTALAARPGAACLMSQDHGFPGH